MAEQIHKSGQDENVATEATYFAKQIVYRNINQIPSSTANLLGINQESGKKYSAVKIGIQGFPGMKLHFQNKYTDPLIIGGTGIFELDLSDSGGVINFLSLDKVNDFILPNPIIIDVLYQTVSNSNSEGVEQ